MKAPGHIDPENFKLIQSLRLFDDLFFTKFFEGNTECIQLVLRIILDIPDLVVIKVRTQAFVGNLNGRAVCLDIWAVDGENRHYDIEIQRSDSGAKKRRARFNSSLLDAHLLQKGSDFDELPETYVIFITENDVIGRGLPVYRIERCFLDNGEIFGDGSHILYVNGAYRGDTPLGKLMHDFRCRTPSEMYYDLLADRARFFKETMKGVSNVQSEFDILFAQILERKEKEQENRITQRLTKQLTEQIEQQVTEQLKQQLTEQMEQQVTEQMEQRLTKQLKQQLTEQMEQQVTEQLKQQLTEQMEQQLSKKEQELTQKIEQKAAREATRSFALRMLAAGKYSLEDISDLSGLSREELEQLQKSA